MLTQFFSGIDGYGVCLSGISCWNHTGALLSCTRIRCVISVAGLLLPVCLSLVQLVLKGSWSNEKIFEEPILVWLSLMAALQNLYFFVFFAIDRCMLWHTHDNWEYIPTEMF